MTLRVKKHDYLYESTKLIPSPFKERAFEEKRTKDERNERRDNLEGAIL